MPSEHSLPSPRPSRLTRRSVLGAAAGGAAALAYGSLPAWAKPVAQVAGVRRPDSLPFPHLRAGTESMPQIKHVVVLMMENHSFDNLLGMVPHRVPGRRKVDGFTLAHGRPVEVNLDTDGSKVLARPMSSPCQLAAHPGQDWNASHVSWDAGRNDGFVKASGPVAMSFWDNTDLPFTYSLVRHFPVGNRYFCSTLAQTYPNRRFLFCGTSSGLVATNSQTFSVHAANGTFFDRLDAHHIDWTSYYQQVASALIVPGFFTPARKKRLKKIEHFFSDAASGRLPAFTFLDPNYETTSEENPQDVQVGERFVAKVVKALLHSRPGRTPPCSSPTTSTAATTTTFPRRGPSGPTTSRRSRYRTSRRCSRAPLTATASVSRPWSSRRGLAPTTSPTSSRTTRRSPRSSSTSGTCRR